MVLDLPGGLFEQRDVRETAGISGTPVIGDFTSSQHTHSGAASGGLTTHKSGDGSDHADVSTNTSNVATNTSHTGGDGSDHADVLTNTNAVAAIVASIVTSNVAGDGIDVSSATGDVTISAEDSTAGNKGIVIVSPGEGMDVSYASGTATIAGEDSTAANKGIIIVAGGEGIDVSYAGGTATIAGEDASTANKGVAKFNTDDFTVSSGDVSLKSKTSYWSCTGHNFMATVPATQLTSYGGDAGTVTTDVNVVVFWAPIFLPQGAVVTAAVVYGNAGASAETWELERFTIAAPAVASMASANIGTADTSIGNATIDNSTYAYHITTSSLDTGDIIYGAIITYTTDYI